MIEISLQFFISIIHTELLKTVENKVIKTLDVKGTNVISGFLRAEKYFSANVLLGHIDDVVRQGHNGLFYSHKGPQIGYLKILLYI